MCDLELVCMPNDTLIKYIAFGMLTARINKQNKLNWYQTIVMGGTQFPYYIRSHLVWMANQSG